MIDDADMRLSARSEQQQQSSQHTDESGCDRNQRESQSLHSDLHATSTRFGRASKQGKQAMRMPRGRALGWNRCARGHLRRQSDPHSYATIKPTLPHPPHWWCIYSGCGPVPRFRYRSVVLFSASRAMELFRSRLRVGSETWNGTMGWYRTVSPT